MQIKGTWNVGLPPDFERAYEEGQSLRDKSDVIIRKNRMSGLWAEETKLVDHMKREGIRTVMFAGTKTDMCVMAGLLDAWHSDFDVLLLKGACGTKSPDYVSKSVEFNCARIWGFVSDSKSFEQAIDNMLDE